MSLFAVSPVELDALRLSLWVALVAVALSLPLAVAVAYVLARYRFWGHGLLNALVHLPLVLPPVVTGYLLLLAFGRKGTFGPVLEVLGVLEGVAVKPLILDTRSSLPINVAIRSAVSVLVASVSTANSSLGKDQMWGTIHTSCSFVQAFNAWTSYLRCKEDCVSS